MRNLLAISALLALAATGCLQQDTTSDTTKQEINRQNLVADTVQEQYSQFKGQFSGSIGISDILLTLDSARMVSTGNGDLSLVPTPTLVGNLSFTPRVFVSGSATHPMSIPYSITGGQYVHGNDLTLTVQQNGTATTLHCKVISNDTLNCNWYQNASTASRATFTLTRVAAGATTAQQVQDDERAADPAHFNAKRNFKSVYIGSNDDYAKIKAEFRAFLEPQTGSLAVPQVAIVGSFKLWAQPTADQIKNGESAGSANFPFTDGNYDPISNTIAIKITGTNSIEVNCVALSETAMHCTWVGNHGASSYEDFDLVRANQSE